MLLTRKLLIQRFLLVKLKSSFAGVTGWPFKNINVPLVISTSRSFPHSLLITGFVTRLTRWVPLVAQEQLTLPEHLSSLPVLSGVCVARSLVLCVCCVDRCLSFCPFPLCLNFNRPIQRFFLDRVQLLKQGYATLRMKSLLHCRHHNLVDRYEISISQMTMNLLFST